jgi:cytochrome c-type biogenesis protein CcmH
MLAIATVAAISGWLATPAYPAEALPVAENPVIEQRLIDISSELRCLVCQNESLAGSRADLAMDLRREIRTMIARGDSDEAIKSYLVSRYGDFILYRPPWKATTLLLWLGPLLLLAIGLALLFRQLRRRAKTAPAEAMDRELNEDERARLARLLASENPPGTHKASSS